MNRFSTRFRPPRGLFRSWWMVGLVLALVLSGCDTASSLRGGAPPSAKAGPTAAPQQTAPGAQPAAAGQQSTVASEVSVYPGSKLEADNVKGPVGTAVTLRGSGFPANAGVTLEWKGFKGRYVLEQEEVVFVGPRYDERTIPLPAARADASGAFQVTFETPEDFGGVHNIYALVDGKFATKLGYTLTPSFSVSATSGPVGMPFEVTARGLGYVQQEALWEIAWDNGFTGYIAGVNTFGTAKARMRLSGPPGQHVLKIWRNYRGIPYINSHQGPFGALPQPNTFVMNVATGKFDAPAIWAEPQPEEAIRPVPAPTSIGGAKVSLSPEKGTVGSKTTIKGEGFAVNQPVKLTWATRVGQKITETGLMEGFEEALKELPVVTAGPDGKFSTDLTIFDDFAGQHRVTAESGDKKADVHYTIYASIPNFTERAKVGEDVSIHMKGVGWTIQGKTYAVVYDNQYLGYGCSFSTRGDIDMHIPATGAPGTHIIDLYPAVYEGKDPTPNIYSKPNLTFMTDHPGGVLPAFRLTLIVE